MAITRNCASCSKENRIPAKTPFRHWTSAAPAKTPLPPIAEPLQVGPEDFDDICPRQQSSCAGGFLGGMVWPMPDGRAARGPSRARPGRSRPSC